MKNQYRVNEQIRVREIRLIDDEGEQNGQQPPPGDVLVFLNDDDQRGGHRQDARKGCCLTEGGMIEGSIVMMKMPKPKPVVRCTKLAPMLNRKSSMTILSILL